MPDAYGKTARPRSAAKRLPVATLRAMHDPPPDRGDVLDSAKWNAPRVIESIDDLQLWLLVPTPSGRPRLTPCDTVPRDTRVLRRANEPPAPLPGAATLVPPPTSDSSRASGAGGH